MIFKFKHLFSSQDEQIETVHPNPNSDSTRHHCDVEGGQDNSPARAPRDDNSFFVQDEMSGDAGADAPPSASAPTWMSIAMNNNVAALAIVAALAMLATALTGAIGILNTRTEIKISKATATNCLERERRLVHDAKPRRVADVATAAAVPSLEGRKLQQACTVTIDPPDVSSSLTNCVGSMTPGNNNVLQKAIIDASDDDVICMNPGKYYTACLTRINKRLTIRGACGSVPFVKTATFDPATFNPTLGPRPDCAASGETVWVASNTKGDSNGALQGIFVDTSDVTIDGISFYEETETFRRTVGVLCDAISGTYQNIKVLNNYMKGEKISSTCPIGGADGTKFPKTIINLEYR